MLNPEFDPYEMLQELSEGLANQSELIVQIIQAQRTLSDENAKLLALHRKNSQLLQVMERRLNAFEQATTNNSTGP